MKNLLVYIIITLMATSCKEVSKAQVFEGNIYITLINLYDTRSIVPIDKVEEYKKAIIDFNYDSRTNSEKELNNYLKILIKNNLFGKPCFQLKLKSEEMINVYVDETEYLKLKKELDNLDRDKEQIKVKFEGSKISDGINNRAIYSASKILLVKKSAGSTDWHK